MDASKRDMQFLLRQLGVMEHAQDREGIAAVAKRNGIAYPMFEGPTTLAEFEALMAKKNKR